jgi:PKHD-type hydroxylase
MSFTNDKNYSSEAPASSAGALNINKNILQRYYFQNVFTTQECNQIINIQDTDKQRNYTEYGKNDNSASIIKSKYINKTINTNWVWERLQKYAWLVNNDYFQFKLSYLDDLQIMEYQENSVFHWHIDINGPEHFSSRKLSLVVFLSERIAFEGGKLLFGLTSDEKTQLEMTQGSMVIFPSFQVHKVSPVTRGKRQTLVAWAHGEPFC